MLLMPVLTNGKHFFIGSNSGAILGESHGLFVVDWYEHLQGQDVLVITAFDSRPCGW